MTFSQDSNGILYAQDNTGNRVLALGTTVPANGTAGYKKGALFIDTDVAAGTTGLYQNVGDESSCEFNAIVSPDTANSHGVIAAGEHTTAGGDANETISISGLLATDIVIVTLHTAGATPRTITTAQAAADQINVVMSGDPSTDHVLSYMALRPVAES